MSQADPRIPALALTALGSGTLFGGGLALAGMVDPRRVLAFLDVAGDWNPSLLFVLGGAVVVSFAGFRLARSKPAPLLDDHFQVRAETPIDAPLLLGAAIFGIGWGLGGYCPGPVIGSLGFGNPEALWFVPAMLVGAGLRRWQSRERRVL